MGGGLIFMKSYARYVKYDFIIVIFIFYIVYRSGSPGKVTLGLFHILMFLYSILFNKLIVSAKWVSDWHLQ